MLNNIVGLLNDGVTTPPNSYESISTYTIGSGGAADVTFSSIPATYKHLQIRILGKDSTTGTGDLRWQFNGDTATNYTFHWLTGNGASPSAGGYGGTAYGNINNWATGTGATDQFSVAIIDLLDYTDTNKFTTGRALSGRDNNGSGQVDLSSMSWRNTAAVTSIKLYLTTGNIGQYSSFALYGIKG
jgi:hypothetical protein